MQAKVKVVIENDYGFKQEVESDQPIPFKQILPVVIDSTERMLDNLDCRSVEEFNKKNAGK